MSTSQVVIRGTLRADGSLELAEQPSLPAGPVEVIIRSLPTADTMGEDFLQYLQQARTELEASGSSFRTKEEIDADLQELRSGDKRLEDVYNQMKATYPREQPNEC
jgi:hypothetical protein